MRKREGSWRISVHWNNLLPHSSAPRMCYVLNICGVILYLPLPWITAQAGIGMSSELSWAIGRDLGNKA